MPGPGAYNPSDVDSSQGGYIVSNFRNTGNVKFIKPKLPVTGLRSRTPHSRVGKCDITVLWQALNSNIGFQAGYE